MHHPQRGRVTQTLKGLFIGSKWEVSSAAVKSVETQSYHVPQSSKSRLHCCWQMKLGLVRVYSIEIQHWNEAAATPKTDQEEESQA